MADIESNAITSFDHFVADGKIKTSFIQKGDKYPVWDGEIIFYENKQLIKNEDILFRVPIQIKGETVKDRKQLTRKIISKKFPRKNLELFNDEDGVMLIEVKYFNKDNYKIFYSELLPIKLKNILSQKGKSYKNIKIKYYPLANREEFEIFV